MGAEDLKRFLEDRGKVGGRDSRPPALMRDLYRGVMLGVAAGNALGLPAEGYSREWTRERFPDGLRDVAVAEKQRPWDDDLAQTVLVAEAILERDELTPDDLAEIERAVPAGAAAGSRYAGFAMAELDSER